MAGSQRFLRFVLVVAVGGVAVGVASLVLALAIVRGFSSEISRKIVGFGAHVQVENFRDAPLPPGVVDAARLARLPGVVSVAPSVVDFVLARTSAAQIEGVSLWGVETLPPYVASTVVPRTFSLDVPDAIPGDSTAPRAGVVVGATLARRLGVAAGGTMTLITLPDAGQGGGSAGFGGFGGGGPVLRTFRVAGVFETSLANFDDLYVFADIGAARRLLGLADGETSRYDLTLATPDSATVLARRIENEIGPPVLARSIFEVYSSLFAWVQLQESVVPLVLTIIVIVAAFNLVGILLMMILEKTGDLAILRSMGATARQVRRLFVGLGLAIGLLGCAIGAALAVGLAAAQTRWALIRLPAEAYFLDRAPVELRATDIGIVVAVALILCLVAAYVPARVAARLDPVRVLRFR